MPTVDIKSINYQKYAESLLKATDGIGTDESTLYQVAKDIRTEIAAQVNKAGFDGERAVEQQNTLIRQATKYLGDAYSLMTKEKGNTDYIKGEGTETIETILREELSGYELSFANRLYGFEAYTEHFETHEKAMKSGQITSAVAYMLIWEAVIITGTLSSPLLFALGLTAFASASTFALLDPNVEQKNKDWDPKRIQADAEYHIYA